MDMENVFGRTWRQGRRVGRCIHMMVGVEASENDVLIGVFDTPELAAHIVALHNDLVERAVAVVISVLGDRTEGPVLAASLKENIQRHHRVLNRLESHLGCVVCRGPLTEGVCPTCDPLLIDGSPNA
jgi:hypothetical protein